MGRDAGWPASRVQVRRGFAGAESDDPLAPYLYLFIAQRQRAAAEAADRTANTAVKTAALAKYRDYLARARNAPDLIFALIADDLERHAQRHVRKVNEKH